MPATRPQIAKARIKALIQEYLPTVLDCESLTNKHSVRLIEEDDQDLVLKLANGQRYEIEIKERSN